MSRMRLAACAVAIVLGAAHVVAADEAKRDCKQGCQVGLETCKADCQVERDSGTNQESDRYRDCDRSCHDSYADCKNGCESD